MVEINAVVTACIHGRSDLREGQGADFCLTAKDVRDRRAANAGETGENITAAVSDHDSDH